MHVFAPLDCVSLVMRKNEARKLTNELTVPPESMMNQESGAKNVLGNLSGTENINSTDSV